MNFKILGIITVVGVVGVALIVDKRFDFVEEALVFVNNKVELQRLQRLDETPPYPEGVEFQMERLDASHVDAFSISWSGVSLEEFLAEHPNSHFIHMKYNDADLWLNWDAAHIEWKLDEDAPPEEEVSGNEFLSFESDTEVWFESKSVGALAFDLPESKFDSTIRIDDSGKFRVWYTEDGETWQYGAVVEPEIELVP